MKIMFYALRPFDEQAYCEPYSKQYGIDYAYTAEVPTPDNLELAKGCDAVSTNPCLIAPEYLEAWAAMGVKFLPCRSIGYDHIPQQKAKELGMRISHSWYPPAGVADYAIMLMLMCNRKVGQILRRADAQDYSLSGKMGRDITRMTVGVIGTGNIGRTVLRHLSGFGCKLLAYDLYPNDEARQYAEYVDLDTLYKSCDIITLHTNATAANRHMIDANAIAKMKNGVVLINTARGTLIDPEALINGLESGKIGAAGLGLEPGNLRPHDNHVAHHWGKGGQPPVWHPLGEQASDEGGGGAAHHIQGIGGKQIGDDATHEQPRRGGREQEGQDRHGLGHPELDSAECRDRQSHGEHGVDGGDQRRLTGSVCLVP